MNNLRHQLLKHVYIYDNGDYVFVVDLMRPNVSVDLSYDTGHLNAIVRTESELLGEVSFPIRHRLEDEPNFYHNNGIITLEGKLKQKPGRE